MRVLYGSGELKSNNYIIAVYLLDQNQDLATASIRLNLADIDQNTLKAGCEKDKTLVEKILPIPESDFHLDLSIAMSPAGSKQVINITSSCSERCYLKIFNINENGEITVWEDSQKKRQIKNKPYPIKIAPDSTGKQYVLGVASTQPFSYDFNINQSIGETDFITQVKLFRTLSGKHAERLKQIEVK